MKRNYSIKEISTVLIIITFLLGFVLVVNAQQQPDPIPYNSTYKHYGYYPQQKLFTMWDGLRYTLPDFGGIQVLNQGNRPVLTYGFAMSADFNGTTIIKTELDFNWTWAHTTEQVEFTVLEENETEDFNNVTYVMTKHIFERTNNDNKFPITERWEFDPLNEAKVTHFLTNNFNDLTNFRFWYIMKNPGMVRFDGELIDTRNADINRAGRFNRILRRVEFSAGSFLYEDLIDNGFDLRNVRIGDGAIIGLPGVSVMALGFTKGDGNFPKGITVELDPASTGFKAGTSVGDPAGSGWTNPTNSRTSNNIYATSTTVGSLLYTEGYDFGIPANADIVGFEMQLEARSQHNTVCPIKTGSTVSVNMSLNNFTGGNSDSKFTNKFPCVFGAAQDDTVYTLGSSSDLWGLSSTLKGSDINTSFRTSLRHRSISTVAFNPGFDAQSVNIYWETGPPDMSSNPPGLNGNNVISSTFLINVTADQNMTSVFLETNYTGTFVNYTITEEGDTNNWARIFEGNSNSADGDEGANDGSTLATDPTDNMSFNIYGCVGTDCSILNLQNITTISALPTVTVNSPLDNSNHAGNASIVFNVTNNDSDGDTVDLIMVATYGSGFNIGNYLKFSDNLKNGTDSTFNLSTGTIDAGDSDLIRLFRMDNLNRFDESLPFFALVYDFSQFNRNATAGGANDIPETCTSRTITPLQDQCLEFDGGEALELLNGTDTEFAELFSDKIFSITVWVYNTGTATDYIMAKGSGSGSDAYFEFSHVSTVTAFRFRNSTALTCNAIGTGSSQNAWNHIAVVGNGTHIKMYTNGVETDDEDCSNSVINITRWGQDSPTFETYMGAGGASGTSQGFNGAIDMLAIWNRSLTQTEITNIYNLSRSPFEWATKQWDSPLGAVTSNFSFNMTTACSISFVFSDVLGSAVSWGDLTIPVTDESANGNNGVGVTDYNITITASGCTSDLQTKSTSALASGANTIPVSNEKYSYNQTNSSVPSVTKTPFTTSFVTLDTGLGSGTVFFKYFLNISSGQSAGTYNNTLELKVSQE